MYCLTTADVANLFRVIARSKSFRSSYIRSNSIYNLDDTLYLVVDITHELFDEIISFINRNQSTLDCIFNEFFIYKIEDSNITKINKHNIRDISEFGLMHYIEYHYNLSNYNNISYCIYDISEDLNLNPIELVNKIALYNK